MKDIEKLIVRFTESEGDYADYLFRLKAILKDILDLHECSYQSIEGRVKTKESLRNKLSNLNVKKVSEVQDLVGVRVITYVYKDVEKIEQILNKHFVCKELKVEERLGTDRVGYRSRHWLISLSPERLKLPEYQRFAEFKAELQIRTILQHAWAQIGHNQVYKPSSILPDRIKRDFLLLSGLLEIADNEFGRISKEISKYQSNVKLKAEKGDLQIPLDTISIREYFDSHFKALVESPTFGPQDDMAEEIIDELKRMDITTLEELDRLNTDDVREEVTTNAYPETNYTGAARSLMILSNADKYFSKAWRKKWTMGVGSLKQYEKYNKNISSIVKKYNVKIDANIY
ncbi:RelA/SpoT domain-containing protein [Candidatus Nomurabacteria bacterium]|nr:RelA/SpoT domain-containing protein [Candidatus Nomurabacteria bacterium]